ncbi:hypothetical protein BXZ70DRAFT_910048 [Cristinia sonorae]|uniref:Uncharacterized protein n=1 Tax=Cristinia sonorae TaxID=1940300 RepID=A0A8K0UGD9_9AGAR|nr:hypothetical protein BXZ70DRAFT_910048 [Cristinia sonorae]
MFPSSFKLFILFATAVSVAVHAVPTAGGLFQIADIEHHLLNKNLARDTSGTSGTDPRGTILNADVNTLSDAGATIDVDVLEGGWDRLFSGSSGREDADVTASK